MANYENGANTRQAIVQACAQLFYEKGFHETSYSDICNLAHVNRGTIYYHFASKDLIRYDAYWEYILYNKRIAEKYCSDFRYHYILSMYMFWLQSYSDEKMGKYIIEWCNDFPVYTGMKDLSHTYFELYQVAYGSFFDFSKVPELAFASIYGYLMSYMRLMCEYPEKFDPIILLENCVKTCFSAWGFSYNLRNEIWENALHYLTQIPEEEIKIQF